MTEARLPPLAGLASIGAGTIHLAAGAAEREVPAVGLLLAVVGVVQLAWGAASLTLPDRGILRSSGAAVAMAVLGGWIAALTIGLPAPSELTDAIEVGVPDLVAALLSVVVLVVLGRASLSARASGDRSSEVAGRGSVGVAGALVALVTLGAVVAVPTTTERRRDDRAAQVRREERTPDEGDDVSLGDEEEVDPAEEGRVGPYDPEATLDLSGVPTVSAEQEAAAGALVREVLAAGADLPSFEQALADGYVSIGDEFTGEEHLLDWSAVLDPGTLDPERPEGLVFDVADDGSRTLAAVMFVLPPSTKVDDAPAPGGDLTRWHLHGDLCLDPAASPPAVTATTDAAGACPEGLVEQRPSPTLHVWLVAHPCGPFSELEGVGTDPDAVTEDCVRHH